jgi:hypothetical protein
MDKINRKAEKYVPGFLGYFFENKSMLNGIAYTKQDTFGQYFADYQRQI